MIIKRNYFYYVSTNPDLEKSIIKPTVPDNFLVRGKFIDWKTKRIRLYRTIEDAISGLYLGERFKDGTKVYVYRAVGINKDYLHGPQDITKVPYALILSEFWYTSSLRLERLGEIKIEKKGEEKFKYGPRQTVGKIYRWRWYEERSYSILSDLRQGYYKIRRNNMSKSIQRDIVNSARSSKLANTIAPIHLTDEQRAQLEKIALVNNARVRDEAVGNSRSARAIRTDVLLRRAKDPEIKAQLTKDLNEGINYQILSARDLGEDALAHEIGHTINRNNPTELTEEKFDEIKRRLSGSVNNVRDAKPGYSFNSRDRDNIELLKNDSKLIKREEGNATKNGIKLLRVVGANRSQIKNSKKALRVAGNTYNINDIAWKSAERDRLNTKAGGNVNSNYRDDLKELREKRRARHGRR